MALISSASKSGRLLASRRYTHETLTDAQESFTNVLDLQASETYTQAGYIPSSGLPFSGSTQINSSHTVSGSSVLKYWYRHKLTKSNTNNETWFFLSPTGSDSGIGAQLINTNQEVNFVSPKYSTAALATSTTADSTPGYLATLYKSSAVSHSVQTGSLDGDDIVSTNDYIFDYKTGVIEFKNSSLDPTNSEYLYMTVYQYTGTTLATGLDVRGNITGSNLLVTGNSKVEGDLTLGGNITIGDAASDSVTITADLTSHLIPNADATYDLGSSSQGWNDLHLGSGGVINFNNGDVTATHSANLLSVAGGNTRVIRLEVDSAADYIDVSTDLQIVAVADITLDPGGNNVKPGSDNADALGVSGTAWSDLFLGDGAVINFNAGDVTATHSSNLLSVAGGNTRVIRLELDSASDYLDVSTDLQIVAAADVSINAGGGNVKPSANDGSALGVSGTAWSDLFLADAGVINWNAGNTTVTGGSSLVNINVPVRATKVEVDSAADYLDVSTDLQIIAAADITLNPGGNNVKPGGDSEDDLGVDGTAWRKLFVDDIDLNGQGRIDLDADADTSVRSSADDVITFEAGAVDIAQMNATMALSGSSISTGSFGYLNVDGDAVIGGNLTFGDAATDSVSFSADITSHIIPNADATYDLGSSSQGWNDLHLGSGGVINFNNGDLTATHSANLLTLTGGNTRVDRLEIDSAVDYIDVSTDLKVIAANDIILDPAGGQVSPASNDDAGLGEAGTAWSDLFLAEGGVINWDSGDATLTQASDVVTLAGATLTGTLTNALSITANGGIGMTSYNASAAVSNLSLDIDGMTDIGADLAAGDIFAVDDGAGGTNRKVTIDRIADFVSGSAFSKVSGDVSITGAGVATVTGAETNAALTAGDGISAGGTFNGATARTFALDLNEFSSVAVASGDRLATLDSDNSTEQLTTVDDLADYVSGSAFSKTSGDITIAGTGVTTIGATKVTGAMLNDDVISAQTNLGSAGVAQSDEFMFSDAGVIKALTFSNLEDTIFANIGGDIAIAAGGTATVTGATTNAALTAGNGLTSGGTFDGATARTFSVDSGSMAAYYSGSAFGKVSGDITIAGTGVSTIGADTVANTMLENMAANTVKVRNAGDAGDPSDLALATTQLLIGDGTGFTAAALSGDVTMTNAGVVTIGNDKIDSQHYAADSIDAEHYAAGSVDATAIGNDEVNSQHYAAGSIDNEHLADDAVDSDELAADSVDDAHLSDGVATGLAGDGLQASSGVMAVDVSDFAGNGLEDDGSENLRVDISGLSGTLTAVDQADYIAVSDEDATNDVTKKVTFSHFEDEIFGNVSGDVLIAAGGAATIQATSVENSMLADDAVNSDEIASGAVDDDHLSDGVATGLAGTGMTASGGVMNVIGGTGITANADDIAITADSVGDTQLAFNTGQHLTTSSSPTFTGIIATSDVTIQGNLTVTGDRIEAQVGSLQVADHTITVGSGSTTSATMNQAGLDFGVSGSVAFLRYDHSTTNLSSSVDLTALQLHSTIATGTAPLTVSSTTVVSNLNADKLDGQEGSYYTDFSNMTVTGGEIVNAMIGDDEINSEHYAAGSIDNEHIADDAINSEHYADLSIDLGHLAADSVDGSKIVDDAIDSEHYAALSIDLGHLAADSVDGSKIVDDAINSEHYAAGSIDTAHIAADQITAALIADDVINSEHYAAASIDNEHLADDAVGADELAADAVVNASVASGAAIATSKLSGAVTSISSHGLASSATTDTTNASNIGSGTLAAARMASSQTAISDIHNANLKIGASSTDEYIDFGTDAQITFAIDDVEEFRMSDGGTFHANADVVAYSSTVASDMNLKENITDMKYGLSDIMKLRGVEYDWKREDMGHDVGVLAQEVEAVIPELVKEHEGLNGRGKFKAVDYNKLVPVLIESIKELKSEIDELKKNQN